MAVPQAAEKWTGSIRTVKIGATKAEGGTRGRVVAIGGQQGIPFLGFEGAVPNPPAIAIDVLDTAPRTGPRSSRRSTRTSGPIPRVGQTRRRSRGRPHQPPPGGDAPGRGGPFARRRRGRGQDRPRGGGPPAHRLGLRRARQGPGGDAARGGRGPGENCLLGAVTEKEYRTLAAAAQAAGTS